MKIAIKGRQTCSAITAMGVPCRANTIAASKFCFFHDPRKSAQRHAARKAGGVQRSKKAAVLPPDYPHQNLKTAADISKLIEVLINRTPRGELDPRVANSVGYLAAQMLKACSETNFERRLAALEANAEKVVELRADSQTR